MWWYLSFFFLFAILDFPFVFMFMVTYADGSRHIDKRQMLQCEIFASLPGDLVAGTCASSRARLEARLPR